MLTKCDTTAQIVALGRDWFDCKSEGEQQNKEFRERRVDIQSKALNTTGLVIKRTVLLYAREHK